MANKYASLDAVGSAIQSLARDRYSGFMPDAQKYQANIEAQIAELLGQVAGGEEAFNADLASRGIFSAGEAPKALYSSVYAPIARAGASAIASGNLGLEQARMQGYGAQQNARLQAVQLWLNQVLGKEQLKRQDDATTAGFLGDLFGTAGQVAGAYFLKGTGGGK